MITIHTKRRHFTRYRVTEDWFRDRRLVQRTMNRLLSDGMEHARYQYSPKGFTGHVLTVWSHKTETEIRSLIREAEDKESAMR